MGYYSEVGLCLTTDASQRLQELLQTENNEETRQMVEDLLSEARHLTTDNGAAAYYWDNLKWYADFSDVSFIETFISSLPWEDYLFIRVGEDNEDTDYRGGLWDNPFTMGLSRCITFD